MHHKPLRQLGIRLGVMAVVFAICTLLAWLIHLPYAWAWGGMLSMLAWTSIINKVM